MSWWGKIIGSTLGLLSGGPLGLLLGAAAGHYFDKGHKSLTNNDYSLNQLGRREREQTQLAFFTATFSVLGHLAKADGRVTEQEIAHTEKVISQMGLSSDQRQVAINLFSEGKKAEFDLAGVLTQFKKTCKRQRSLLQMFLEIQIQSALADNQLTPPEKKLLREIASMLNFSQVGLELMIQRVQAERYFHQGQQRQAQKSNQQQLQQAYHILELQPGASFKEVKTAYRRLMAQHHPDKLIAKGLPEEMLKLANEKTLEIKQAYELIQKQHKPKG